MLKVNDLTVHYGVIPALKSVSLTVSQGEVVALIGANGAGKTTSLHTISGLKRPTSGSISFMQTDISQEQAHNIVRLGLSQVPEGRGVFPNLSVVENLYLGAYLRNDRAEIEKDADWAYGIFPRLYERKQQQAGTLSGGELQMLAIARALMTRPKLLLMDEPSMGLSPILVEEIFRTIHKLNVEHGVTILLVEQNAQMALHVSHRAYVIETGQIVFSGRSRELRRDSAIKKAYLGL
ncbi:MAG: ABC transporter ATP-binding protein [Christensenellales bacterium]|jgi:branched-chain amino acid transport system ATP-binding protein